MEPKYVAKHFVPLALDTYFRGNSHELEFCNKVQAGGNHLVVATAAGQTLGKGDLRLRKKELEGAGAKVAGVSILTPRRRPTRTPADRRGTAQFWWEQTKSGSGARPKPPGVDQEVEAALH